jgi:hypothetical protein
VQPAVQLAVQPAAQLAFSSRLCSVEAAAPKKKELTNETYEKQKKEREEVKKGKEPAEK